MSRVGGHIKHFHKNVDITFGEIEEFIDDIFSNRVSGLVEKIDGHPIGMTYMDNQYLFTWQGKEWRTIDELIEKEFNQELPKKVYREVAESLLYAFQDLENPEIVFDNGRKHLNMEIVSRDMPNMILYYRNAIVMHYMVDEEGNTDRYAIYPIFAQLKQPSKYRIMLPQRIVFPKSQERCEAKQRCMYILHWHMNSEGITRDMSVWDYLVRIGDKWWLDNDAIGLTAPERDILYKITLHLSRATICKKNFPDNVRYLVDRWFNEGGSKQLIDAYNAIIYIYYFVLDYIYSILPNPLCKNIEESVVKMNKLYDRAYVIKMNKLYDRAYSENSNKNQLIIESINRLRYVPGFIPSEGVVFTYNGDLYKLTGKFTDFITVCKDMRQKIQQGEYEYRG